MRSDKKVMEVEGEWGWEGTEHNHMDNGTVDRGTPTLGGSWPKRTLAKGHLDS